MSQNPLQKYFRQPKIYISLPSKGLYYPPNVLQGDYNNVPIFAMTGMDEIIMKTPDALFNGEATVKVIESCCPYIKDASLMPSIDVDSILIAIKIATFGDDLTIERTCSSCGASNTYDFGLSKFLDLLKNSMFNDEVKISDEIVVKLRPVNYKALTTLAIENFKLQKHLYQVIDLPEDESKPHIEEIYKNLANLELSLFLDSIESVNAGGVVVTDKKDIEEWLKNSDREVSNTIKKELEKNKEKWEIPAQKVLCTECNAENDVNIILDQSNFFGQS